MTSPALGMDRAILAVVILLAMVMMLTPALADNRSLRIKVLGSGQVGGMNVLTRWFRAEPSTDPLIIPTREFGTVTPEVVKAVREFQGGRVEFRADAFGNLHVPVGRASWEAEKLAENAQAFVDHIIGIRPSSVKGIFLARAALSTTMGPGVKLAV